jgi:hypothetical protein
MLSFMFLSMLLSLSLACGSTEGIDDGPDPVGEPGPWLVAEPSYTPDSAAELLEWGAAYEGQIGPQKMDAVVAYLQAEDAIHEGDRAGAAQILDKLWEQYPIGDDSWWGTEWSAAGEHVGYPAAYYGLRMLTETAAVAPAPSGEPIRMGVVLVDCSEGVIPTTQEELSSGTGPETRRELDADLLENASPWVAQATEPFSWYVQAITDGQLELQVSVFHLQERCATVQVTESEGRYFAGPSNVEQLLADLPEEIRDQTHWWWVVHPSAVPDQVPGAQELEFVTGGMGRHKSGAPLFLSDDLWLKQKPFHMGEGDWYTLERRIYFNQWLQHEFAHHLFLVYPEFELEVESHQWFDRSTWPSDFEGQFEADYYAEAVEKRLQGASPSLNAQLRYAKVPEGLFSGLDVALLVGDYNRQPVENEWHSGRISVQEENLLWTNDAGVSWGLEPDLAAGVLRTGPDCPYDGDFVLTPTRDLDSGEWTTELAGFTFNGELYSLAP